MKLEEAKTLIYEALEANNGIVKKEQITALGIDYRKVLSLLNKGEIVRVKNGYYAKTMDAFTQESLVHALFPDGLLCMESALYAYGYIKNKPLGWRIAIDKNTSKSRFKMDYPKIVPYYTEPEVLKLGATTIKLDGVEFGIYDKERLICDCLKYESKLAREDFKAAIQGYIKDEDKDILLLMEYARERKVVKKVQSLIGVWL